MIYGSELFRKEFLKDTFEYAEKKKWQIIFISLVGSIGKGFPSADSDYDTRVLYLDKNYPGKIFLPWNEKQDFLKHQYYLNEEEVSDGKVWEWIPFWEATSFFQFLKNPKFSDAPDKHPAGLYNILAWTMNSPYCWDPYGLQMKLKPLVDKAFRAPVQLKYLRYELERYYYKQDKKEIPVKTYLRAIYSALSIDYVLQKNEFNLAYLSTLIATVCPKNLRSKISAMIDDEFSRSVSYVKANGSKNLGTTQLKLLMPHDSEIDAYIERMYNLPDSAFKQGASEDEIDEILCSINKILFDSVNDRALSLYAKPYRDVMNPLSLTVQVNGGGG
ncbi:MAG: DNA polymerase beta superfamily protein [Treponema sp.]